MLVSFTNLIPADMQLPRAQPTVFLSHDWPIGIARHGDTKFLLKRKPFFKGEVSAAECQIDRICRHLPYTVQR